MSAEAPHSGLEAPSGDVNCSVNCSAQGINCSASGVNCSGGPAAEGRDRVGPLRGVRMSELFRGGVVPLVWSALAAQAQVDSSGELKGAGGRPCVVVGRRTPM
jgi:hypothetical protein